MGKVRPGGAVGGRAPNGVAGGARLCQESRPSRGGVRTYRHDRISTLRSGPARVLGGCFGDDHYRHMAVLQAAEFGALTAIDTRLFRPQQQAVGATRDEILLAGETGDPKRVDDISTFEPDMNILSDRDVNFIGGLKPRCFAGTGVEHLPPPLLCSHGDRYGGSFRKADAAGRVETGNRHPGNQNDGRSHCGGHDHSQPPLPDLRFDLLPFAPQCASEHEHHRNPDYRAQGDDADNQVFEMNCGSAIGVEGGLISAAATCGRSDP